MTIYTGGKTMIYDNGNLVLEWQDNQWKRMPVRQGTSRTYKLKSAKLILDSLKLKGIVYTMRTPIKLTHFPFLFFSSFHQELLIKAYDTVFSNIGLTFMLRGPGQSCLITMLKSLPNFLVIVSFTLISHVYLMILLLYA